ncbi:nucleotidyltransferase domain-containing protein [Tolypothrix sp. VBCCA 56010]|uniref:nucleotidyltransferase domain-containing protein n=1 Tax=Tolypothrix sp. VBCCA 56010 TaxID=3137731 RepID=UPI003D7D0E3D
MKTFPKPYTKNQSINVRPEVELLLSCARTQIDDERAQRIKSLVKEDIDWQYLIATACRHKLMPLLYNSLNKICANAVPEKAFKELRELFQRNAQRNLFLSGELLKILGLLKERGIVALPYKGQVLATAIYGNLALRQSGDLDVMVQQPDVLEFKEVLLSLGYRPEIELTPSQERAFLQAKTEHSYNFFDEDRAILLEIHWRIAPKYTCPIEAKDLWDKLEPFSFFGTKIPNLSLEDWLPILCVHGSRHRWEVVGWLADIAELIRSHPEINWEKVIAQSNKFGCRRILFLGLFLVNELLGVSIPTEVWQRIKAEPEVTSLADSVSKDFFPETDVPERFLTTTIYQIRVRERLQDKLLYLESFIHWLMTREKSS